MDAGAHPSRAFISDSVSEISELESERPRSISVSEQSMTSVASSTTLIGVELQLSSGGSGSSGKILLYAVSC